MRVRPLDADSKAEIALVARRMRLTLMEVLGSRRGRSMYGLAWLKRRVRFHLDPEKCDGAVFLAEGDDGGIAGHCIVRVERDGKGPRYGLFSTTFVDPKARRRGVAQRLLRRGERWMRARGLRRAATDTSASNEKLIELYRKNGYKVVFAARRMVRLAKRFQ